MREIVPPKTKLKREKFNGIQKSSERKMQSNNGEREKKSKEREEKLSGLKIQTWEIENQQET